MQKIEQNHLFCFKTEDRKAEKDRFTDLASGLQQNHILPIRIREHSELELAGGGLT